MELANEGVIGVGPMKIAWVHGFNKHAIPLFVMLFDATEVPADGAEPVRIIHAEPNKAFNGPGGVFTKGAVWCSSTEAPFLKSAKIPTVWLRPEFADGESGMDALSGLLALVKDPAKTQARVDQLTKAVADARQAGLTAVASGEALAKREAKIVESEKFYVAKTLELTAQEKALRDKQLAHDQAVKDLEDAKTKLAASRRVQEQVADEGNADLLARQMSLKAKEDAFEKMVAKREKSLNDREAAVTEREAEITAQVKDYQTKISRLKELSA